MGCFATHNICGRESLNYCYGRIFCTITEVWYSENVLEERARSVTNRDPRNSVIVRAQKAKVSDIQFFNVWWKQAIFKYMRNTNVPCCNAAEDDDASDVGFVVGTFNATYKPTYNSRVDCFS